MQNDTNVTPSFRCETERLNATRRSLFSRTRVFLARAFSLLETDLQFDITISQMFSRDLACSRREMLRLRIGMLSRFIETHPDNDK